MNYCRNLGFEETPNYAFLRRLFRELYQKCQFENEYIFDWTIQRYRVEMPTVLIQEEHKGTSTLPESLRGHPGIASDDEPLRLPEMQAMNAKQQKDWADREEAKMERQEMQAVEQQAQMIRQLVVEAEPADKKA